MDLGVQGLGLRVVPFEFQATALELKAPVLRPKPETRKQPQNLRNILKPYVHPNTLSPTTRNYKPVLRLGSRWKQLGVVGLDVVLVLGFAGFSVHRIYPEVCRIIAFLGFWAIKP